MSTAPTLGIVVPTRNSARTLDACLRSVREQDLACGLVVVDNHSSDRTVDVARRYADSVLERGPERSAQRNAGAAHLDTDIVGFIDSDMVLTAGVAAEAVGLIRAGAVAVIVPERSFGQGYWSSVRALERSMYDGHDGVEAARFFRRDVFESVGGFDETLNPGTEDWDLTIRVRRYGSVGRTRAFIRHDEGRVGYLEACRKKGYYALSIRDFHAKHGGAALAGALDRPYLRRPWILFRDSPVTGAGVLALKAGEALSVGWRLVQAARSGQPS